jgi:hypothetical protein
MAMLVPRQPLTVESIVTAERLPAKLGAEALAATSRTALRSPIPWSLRVGGRPEVILEWEPSPSQRAVMQLCRVWLRLLFRLPLERYLWFGIEGLCCR